MPELKTLAGFGACLVAAVVWALLAARSPTSTFHFAPMVVGGLWAGLDGSLGAGLTQRRIVNAAIGGVAIAVATAVILETKGDLDGPTFWDTSDTAPVLAEHVVFAVLGGVLGAAVALRVANTEPRQA
ncbi:MAG: hypothetical protein AAGA90_10085 [Actinomycetota bacterium]